MKIWEAYIDAQELMTGQYSRPFQIKYLSGNEGGEHIVELIESPRRDIIQKIKDTFPDISDDDIHLEEGYFLFSTDRLDYINQDRLNEFVKYCDANYFDFVPRPCLTGRVELQADPVSLLLTSRDISVSQEGVALCSLEDIEQIDHLAQQIDGFSRDPNIGAVFPINQDGDYYLHLREALRKTVDEGEDLDHPFLEIKTIVNQPQLKGRHLHEVIPDHFASYHEYRIVVVVEPATFDEFEVQRRQKKIFYEGENESFRSRILPKPVGNTFHYPIRRLSKEEEPDPGFEKVWIKRSMRHYFPEGSFRVETRQYIIYTNANKLVAHVSNQFQDDDTVFVSRRTRQISFDFINKEELESKLGRLQQFEDFDIHIFDNHRYKVQLHYQSPIREVIQAFQDIPSVQSTIHSAGTKLDFRVYINERDDAFLLRNRIQNRLGQLTPGRFQASLSAIDEGRLRYSILFREEEYLQETESHLQYLRGEEVIINHDRDLVGVITEVRYPKLRLVTEKLFQSFFSGSIITLEAPLFGEREKIKRLKDTIQAIFSERSLMVNPRLKQLLINPDNPNEPEKEIWENAAYLQTRHSVEENLLTPPQKINDSQIEAIAKSLMANDLFIIQGPPGTGKSTAIAEIIWQHIQKHNAKKSKQPYRILVTSETNLAVDNALDKLRSDHHTLIKPIRFGAEERLDKEGRRFSIARIKNWMETGETQAEVDDEEGLLPEANIVKDWMQQISSRAQRQADDNTREIIQKWEQFLCDPEEETRALFVDTYKSHVNVVGATCSSIGQLTSTGSMTSFFRDYISTYHGAPADRSFRRVQIAFDLVIQDEASKATPPELALPFVYGKKAIVIGDHRQLPPMVDSGEFLEQLEYLLVRSKSHKERKRIKGLMKIIRRNHNLFDQSHFEFLFNKIPKKFKSTFNLQYRMHPAINETIKQFYLDEGGLECGLVTPVDLGIDDRDLNNPASRYHGISIDGVLSSDTHILWLNVKTPEYKKGTSRLNTGEIQAIDWLIGQISKTQEYQEFVNHWDEEAIEEKQIGVITFYGAQASALYELGRKYPGVPLRISAVDKFQGMERNIVIVSTVRSDCIADFPGQQPDYEKYTLKGYPEQPSMGFAEFPNRLNVALSRAKRLLIIVGNARHFESKHIYRNVLQTITEHPNGSLLEFSDILNPVS